MLAGRRPRLVELLRPQGSWKLLAYRKVVEIRDAVLALHPYTPPGAARLARRYLETAGGPGPHSDAAVLACVLSQARQAKLAARPPVPDPESLAELGGDDLVAEASFLVQVARAYVSPAAREFGGRFDRTPITSDQQ